MSVANPRSGAMMSAARGIASDATTELSQASLEAMMLRLPSAGDPLDDLVARVRPRAGGAVDYLQVAALLEADGVNDRAARVEFGFADVFELADEVNRRLRGGGVRRLRQAKEPRAGRSLAAREVSHGLLYLLPSSLFPAVIAVVEPRPLVVALVLAGGLGWVWAGGASWLAYQGLNAGDRRMAGWVLGWAGVAGIAVAAAVGTAVALSTGGGIAAAMLVPGVMTYQMASTLLMIYRRELWLAAVMAPGAAAGIGYVFAGRALLGWALGCICVCVAAAFGAGLRLALRAGPDQPPSTLDGFRALLAGRAGRFALVLGYGALSAAFLLHAQVPYLLTRLDVVLAGVPLIVAMGVVEWRARRFTEQARRLLPRLRYPRQFVVRVWLLLAVNVAACWLAVAAGAAVLLAVLRHTGWLTPAGVVMAAAHVALAGAYLLAFVLAGHDRYGWLCAALGISIAAHVLTPRLVAPGSAAPLDALVDTTYFLGSAVLLQVLLVVALVPVMGQVWRYR